MGKAHQEKGADLAVSAALVVQIALCAAAWAALAQSAPFWIGGTAIVAALAVPLAMLLQIHAELGQDFPAADDGG